MRGRSGRQGAAELLQPCELANYLADRGRLTDIARYTYLIDGTIRRKAECPDGYAGKDLAADVCDRDAEGIPGDAGRRDPSLGDKGRKSSPNFTNGTYHSAHDLFPGRKIQVVRQCHAGG